VLFSEDPAFVLRRAGVFLASQPVLHNLILSILHARVAQGDPGHYWIAIQRDDVVGIVVQSPLTFPATLTPMEQLVTDLLPGYNRRKVNRAPGGLCAAYLMDGLRCGPCTEKESKHAMVSPSSVQRPM
jgi:hypothetical protein